jgi:hypothetical protein
METQYTNKELVVEVIDVFPDKSAVWIENENASGEYPVVAPANIAYARKGEATVKFNVAGEICYIRSASAPKKTFNPSPGFKKAFGTRPQYQSSGYSKAPYQSKPVQANQYEPEEKESKRIGMCQELLEASMTEIRMMYNTLSFTGKWIVATNIFPRPDKPGKYDAMFYISEKREGFELGSYLDSEPKKLGKTEITEEVI